MRLFGAALAFLLAFGNGGGNPAARIAAMSAAPLAPTPGYSAWYRASAETFSDAAGTTPASIGGPVRNWGSEGSANSYVAKAAGSTHPILRSSVEGAYLEGPIDSEFVAPTGIGTSGVIAVIPPSSFNEFTAFTVAYWNAADDTSAWGATRIIGTEHRSVPSMAAYDFQGNIPEKLGTFTGQRVIVTVLVGVNSASVGVNDTRTASLTTPTLFSPLFDDPLTMMGSLGSRFLNGRLYAVIIYPTVLSEADRKITEHYLAETYRISLPY